MDFFGVNFIILKLALKNFLNCFNNYLKLDFVFSLFLNMSVFQKLLV